MSSTWLKARYPFEKTNREKRDTILTLSLFGGLILVVLQPFGFSVVHQTQHFLVYFLIGSLTAGINYYWVPGLFPSFFEEKKWTVGKALLFLSYNFLILGLWNHIYSIFFVQQNIFLMTSGPQLLESLLKIMIIGLAASLFLVLFRYNLLARRHLELSQSLNQNLESGKLASDAGKAGVIELMLEGNLVKVGPNELTYIRAEGNYIALHFRDETKAAPPLYRATMKQVEEQMLGLPEFFRCHRSFIVNLQAIESSQGNSQGLFIKVDGSEEKIPVARPKIKLLRTILEKTAESKSS
ncbi:MAG: LytTR family transcriptional regulator [Roseivirga sp.]|nr:LytTR family transcriptional regulator [Roseivirga sp.]